MIVEGCDGRKIGLDAKNSVECISLRACLGGLLISCGLSRPAGCTGSLVSTAAINKSVAYKLRDNINVLGGAMVV